MAELSTLHRRLIADTVAQGRYREVLQRRVKAGDRVLDLGTGLGLHALFACQAGASRVYAVEKEDVVELARQIVRVNGFADRIVFVRGRSWEIQLPERVDLIVANLGFDGTLRWLPDARERFLEPGGRLIPEALELFAVPLEWPVLYDDLIGFWDRKHYEFDLSAFRKVVVNEAHWHDFTPGRFLGEPARLARLDLMGAAEAQMGGAATFETTRRGTLHGVGLWFTLWLDAEMPLSTAPPLTLLSPLWGQTFFPVERAVEVAKGERIAVRVKTFGFPAAGIMWKWEVRVEGQGEARFTHASYLPLSLESLHAQAPGSRPALGLPGQAARLALTLCDGATPLQEIEQKVLAEFGSLFRTRAEAAGFVAEVVKRYAG